jgi:hypothetical protein
MNAGILIHRAMMFAILVKPQRWCGHMFVTGIKAATVKG